MTNMTREDRLLESFLSLIEDHRKDFAGYVRDVETSVIATRPSTPSRSTDANTRCATWRCG